VILMRNLQGKNARSPKVYRFDIGHVVKGIPQPERGTKLGRGGVPWHLEAYTFIGRPERRRGGSMPERRGSCLFAKKSHSPVLCR